MPSSILKNTIIKSALLAVMGLSVSPQSLADIPSVTYPAGYGTVSVIPGACSTWTKSERFNVKIEHGKTKVVMLDFSGDSLDFRSCRIIVKATIRDIVNVADGSFRFVSGDSGEGSMRDGSYSAIDLKSNQVNFEMKALLASPESNGSFSIVFTAYSERN